jgi:hypothetical protein
MSFGGTTLNPIFSDYSESTASSLFKHAEEELLYHRRAIGFRIEEDQIEKADEYAIIIEYRDDTVAHSMVTYHSDAEVSPKPRERILDAKAREIAGYTLCGTGRVRHAVFQTDALSFKHGQNGGADLRVEGISNLISFEIVPGGCDEAVAQAKEERVSPVEASPMMELNNPLQLITTAGTDQTYFKDLPKSLDTMKDLCPYARRLGFTGVESYVKWNFVEREQGVFDWSYYDAIIDLAAEYGLKWFPLIIGGSAYALPEWYHDLDGFTGFTCLEHGLPCNVPSIFNDHQTPYVKRYIHEFGKHYEGNDNVYGVRLGPSGNYGESQYPAGGNWGYKGMREHMHFGWWAGDKDASAAYLAWLASKYADIAELNGAWDENYDSFGDIETYHPLTSARRKRKDFVDWYMFEMSDWCEKWGIWMREELKSHDIYQSAGGWGYVECGTDFTDQTKSMVKIGGGIRATNEDESYEVNFAITRMLSSAARFYNVPFGSEPAGFGLARSLIGRLFNIIVNNGQHLFYYHPGFANHDLGSDRWLKYSPLLEQRAYPFIEVGVLYPDTMTKMDDSTIRYLDGSAFFSQVYSLRRKLDFDYCSEQMVLDGALENLKVLVFLSRYHNGDHVEADVLRRIDEWVADGGTVIYPVIRSNAVDGPGSLEGDYTIYNKWRSGDVGAGRVMFIDAIREPLDLYIDDVVSELRDMEFLDPLTQTMLSIRKPDQVYASVLENGLVVLYNNTPRDVVVEVEGKPTVAMEAISIEIV